MTSVEVGDELSCTLVENLTRTQIVQYAGASGDYNPIHTDERYATRIAGYPSVFAHGMLTMGMTGRLLTETFGSRAVLRYGARFVAQVWPGDRLTALAVVTDITRDDIGRVAAIELTTTNQLGETVLTAQAAVRLD